MKYMLLTYLDEKAWLALSEAEQKRLMAECDPHVKQLLSSGRFLAGAPLHPTSTAKTVSVKGGKRLVTAGPFAETREQLGGYTMRTRPKTVATAPSLTPPRNVKPTTGPAFQPLNSTLSSNMRRPPWPCSTRICAI